MSRQNEARQLGGMLAILSLAAGLSLVPRSIAQAQLEIDIYTGHHSSDFRSIRPSFGMYPGSHVSVAHSRGKGREPYVFFGRNLARFVLDYFEGLDNSVLAVGGPETSGLVLGFDMRQAYILPLYRDDTGLEPAIIKVNTQGAVAELLLDIALGAPGSGISRIATNLEVLGLIREAPGGRAESPSRPHDGVAGVYFNANDGVIGDELWITNGIPGAAGTHVVKDINPGAGDSNPLFLTPWESILYFAAQSSGTNRELWRSNGTEAGTVLVKEIRPGPEGSDLGALTEVNGKLWFGANDGQIGSELWMSDGTTEGTVLVADIFPGAMGSIPAGFTKVGDRVLFVPLHPLALELFITDGTAAGTGIVKDISPGPFGSQPRNLTTVGEGDLAMFWADDFGHGLEPWITDGTAQGTRLLMDINSGPGGSAPPIGRPFFPIGTRQVVFTADDGANGPEPWVVDLTTGDVRMVADIYPGSVGSAPNSYELFNGVVLFDADHPDYGREPWTWDPGATAQLFGLACADSFPMPTMEATDPVLGETMRFTGESAPVGTLGAIIFGEPTLDRAPLGAPCTVAIDITQPTLTLGLFPVTHSDWSSTLDLPADPSLVGVLGAAQVAFLGTNTPWGYELANAALLSLGN